MKRRLIHSSALATLVLSVALFASQGAGAATDGNAKYRTAPVRSASAILRGQLESPLQVGPNRLVTNKTGAQSETAVAIDPTDNRHMLASSNDLANFSSFNNLFESFNRGRTWVSAGFNAPAFCYDTWIDFNSAGDAFFSYECSDERIAYRLHGTTNWVQTTLTNAGGFPDRDMVVVDNSNSSPFKNSVYIGYDDNGSSNKAYVMYSRTGTSNWLRSNEIDDTPNASDVIGVNAATAPDGTVYATWEDYANKMIKSDVSHDGGVTWGADHVVTNFRINTTGFFIFIPPQPSRGVLPMPMTTVAPAGSPNAGRLYVTYFDKSPTGNNTNIYFRYSDNGGTTWSAETKVNDDTNNAYHFHPAIAVETDGTIAISFYDTRNDATSKKTDQYISFSTDGGLTWGANQRLTTASSNETLGGADANQYGDYQNIDGGTGFVQPVWTDSRGGVTGKAEETVTANAR